MVFDELIKYIRCAFVTVLDYELHHLGIDFFSFSIIKKHPLCLVSRYNPVGMFESVIVVVF
jgi:hypothetical protein